LGVPRDKISKKSKKDGKIRNLHAGLENGNEMVKCYKLLFYSYSQLKKKKGRANARNFPETRLRENEFMWLYQKIQIFSW
jgi:hypothetical protein